MTDNNSNPEDTGQISVAELLARNGQKSSAPTSGGRRRRGVKGGISVAELTGEIPVVRAEPASDVAPVIATPPPESTQTPAPTQTPESTQTPAPTPQETPRSPSGTQRSEPELLSGSTTAAGDLLNQSHDESERRASTQTDRRAGQRPVPAERPQRSAGFVPRPRVPRPVAKADPKVRETANSDDAVTQVTPAVNGATPAEARTNTPAASTAPAPKASAPKASAPGTPAGKTAPEKSSAPVSIVKSDDRAAEKKAASAKNAGSSEAAGEETTKTDDDGAVREPAAKNSAVKQWLSLIGQGVVAIVVGALLFKGFERLWDVLPWVALILAVLVIVGLVAVVRILRRTDDMFSMVIAIVVGVFVTLGPLAFQLSTG